MDRDEGTGAPGNLLITEVLSRFDLIIKKLEDQQDSIEELIEKINDAMTDRYGTGYSRD